MPSDREPTVSEPSAALRIAIASDNFLTREGLGCLLSGVRGIEIVARVDSHPETLAAVRQYRPDVLIVKLSKRRRPPGKRRCWVGASDGPFDSGRKGPMTLVPVFGRLQRCPQIEVLE